MRGVADGLTMGNTKDEMGRPARLEANVETLLGDVGVLKSDVGVPIGLC